MKTEEPTNTKLTEAVNALTDELNRMAMEACENRDIHSIHWLVSKMRQTQNLPRQVEMRGLRSRSALR